MPARLLWPLGVIFATGLLVYANTLFHGFVWDDLITLDQHIRFYRSPLDAFLEPADNPGFPGVFRPLAFASFWLDQLVWWRNPFGFHLTSVVLHALNGVLVYRLAGAIGVRRGAALIGALLFAVHPIHTEAVAWVTARVDVLATTFTVLALLAFLAGRTTASTQATAQAPARLALWTVLVALCSFLAAASKEPGALVPVLIAGAATLPRRNGGESAPDQPDRGRRRATGGKRAAPAGNAVPAPRCSWIALAASTAGVLAYLALRHLNRSNDGSHLGALDAASITRLVRAFGFYVERLIVPIGLRAYIPELPAAVVTVPFAIAGAMAAVLAARAPRARFAMLWIVVTLLPSMLVAIADISVTAAAERYLYLPSVGLALLVAIALDAGRWDRAAASGMAAGLVLALLATATILRNRVWHDEIALWSDVTRQEQAFALPYLNLGLALADAGRLDEAGVAYQRGLEARATPTVTRDLYVDLGHLELSRQRLDEALAAFTRANAIAPHASADYGIAAVYRTRARAALASGDESRALADFARAREALDAALRINWRHYKSQFMLASVLYQTGDLSGALEHYRKVVEIAPDTDLGADAAEAVRQLSAWLADPAHRAALSERAPAP